MKKTGIFFKYLGNNLDELYQERISSLSGDIQAASEDKVRALEKRVRQLKREKEKTSWLGTKESAGLDSYIWEYQCRGVGKAISWVELWSGNYWNRT